MSCPTHWPVGTPPAAGVRFRELDPLYAAVGNREVTHTVCLPSDWQPGARLPALAEYAGNRYQGAGLDGRLDLDGCNAGARMGWHLAGRPGSPVSGVGCLWVTMPFSRRGGRQHLRTATPILHQRRCRIVTSQITHDWLRENYYAKLDHISVRNGVQALIRWMAGPQMR